MTTAWVTDVVAPDGGSIGGDEDGSALAVQCAAWGVGRDQKKALRQAIVELQEHAARPATGEEDEEPVLRRSRGAGGSGVLRLSLTAYFPKVLIMRGDTRKARYSRYPFEPPLLVVGGWTTVEKLSGCRIGVKSKQALLKKLAWKANALLGEAQRNGGAPRPLSIIRTLVEWLQKTVLEYVPQLQLLLVDPDVIEYAQNDGKTVAAVAAAAAAENPGAAAGSAVATASAAAAAAAPAAAAGKRAIKPRGVARPAAAEKVAPAAAAASKASASPKRRTRGAAAAAAAASPPPPPGLSPAAKGIAPRGVSAKRAETIRIAQVALAERRKVSDAKAASAKQRRSAQLMARRDAKGRSMQQKFEAQKKRPGYKKMLKQRMQLPALAQHDQVIDAIERNQVVIISGATGCGKSTQVPQFVLDSYLNSGRGGHVSVVCTQPRRLAAIGVAERVASERDERCGDTIGYQIRLETKRSAATRLLFCTTGILLRCIEGDAELETFNGGAGVSHIIVDEVHERSIDSDFLLIVLKEMLRRRPTLKLILMSATLQASTFETYFADFSTTVISIPGRTFPVDRFYLEDAIEQSQYVCEPRSEFARQPGRGGGKGGNRAIAGVEPYGVEMQNWIDANGGPNAVQSALNGRGGDDGGGGGGGRRGRGGGGRGQQKRSGYSYNTVESIARMKLTTINNDLIVSLVRHLATRGHNAGLYGASAILVFMPGMGEITKLLEAMQRDQTLGDASSFRLLPLHSSLSTAEQKAVFVVPPKGVTKVVLSTNIAETSVTINDISCVVDCGTHKEMCYDPILGMSCLREVRVAQANASQRAGRAGRVRKGYTYHLFMKKELETMPSQQAPEMLRCPLESIALRIKALKLGTIKGFLSKAIEPPSAQAIDHVIAVLTGLSALSTTPRIKATATSAAVESVEALTPLGHHLSALPVDPRIAKMMIYGGVFRCVEPTLVIAASLAYRSPFFSPMDKRQESDAAKKRFASDSDHILVLNAHQQWIAARGMGRQEERAFLRDNFLSGQTLRMIDKMKNQFMRLMREIGFYDRRKHEEHNLNSGNIGLVKAILCAGLYPNVIKVDAPAASGGKKKKKGGRGGGQARLVTKKLWEAGAKEEVVALHPSSVLNGGGSVSGFLVYHEKVKTTRVYVRDASIVNPLALLLFGGSIKVHHLESQVTLDNWLRFNVAAQHAVLISAMRDKLMEIMRRKVDNPRLDLHTDDEARRVTDALCTLVAPAGGGGGRGGGGSSKSSSTQRKLTPHRVERGEGGGGGGGGGSNVREGDWRCPACQISNFASRQQCFKCGKPRRG